MSICVFGSAFDPIHNGHCGIIDGLILDDQFDIVCLVPTGVSVFSKNFMFSDAQRFHMLSQLYQDHPKVRISDYEIQKDSPSYMIETLQHLHMQFSPSDITLVIGYDQFMNFHQWKFFQEILLSYQLLVVHRKGLAISIHNQGLHADLKQYQQHIQFSELDVPDVSSSTIRAMIQNQQPISHYVPELIVSNIQQSFYND